MLIAVVRKEVRCGFESHQENYFLYYNKCMFMFNLNNKTKKKEWAEVIMYFFNNDKIYKAQMEEEINVEDFKLSPKDLLNTYGFEVSTYDMEYSDFNVWNTLPYKSLEDFYKDSGVNEKYIIREEDLYLAIDKIEKDFEMKFNEIKADDTLYTLMFDSRKCFNSIAKVKNKLINEKTSNIVRSKILEIEVLDGISATTKREFITFYDFINEFTPGCNIKVLEGNIEDYFS